MAATIREVGGRLLLNIAGAKTFAYPTQGGLWIIRGTVNNPDPDPDPNDPEPGVTFSPPFDWSLVTSEYRSPDRPTHDGIDFAGGAAAEGEPIHCAGAGTVVEAVTLHSGWGNYVRVEHSIGSHVFSTLYAHMIEPPPVSVGQNVAKWAVLGRVGNTGNSFGAHLHWETKVDGVYVNPRNFIADWANYTG